MKQLAESITLRGSEDSINSEVINQEFMTEQQILSKKQRIQKNRIIRKNKNQKRVNQQMMNFDRQQRKTLTRDQKHEIQKIKNRQSAQKCRDQKKVYVQNLEKQNIRLIDQNQRLVKCLNNHLCYKCGSNISDNNNQSTINIGQNSNYLQQFQQIPILTNQDDFVEVNQDYSYIRTTANEQHNSIFPYIMMVFVIAIAIFTTSSNPLKTQNPIQLFNLKAISFQKAETIEITTTIIQQQSNNQKKKYELVPVEKPPKNEIEIFSKSYFNTALANYLSQTSQHCLKNYMKHNQKLEWRIKANLRSKPQKQRNRTDILFCDTPRLFKQSEQQNFITPALEIILNGNQLKQIMIKENVMHLDPFPYLGLYALKVQIKEIRKYNDLECLL